jgi:hypothetical protein
MQHPRHGGGSKSSFQNFFFFFRLTPHPQKPAGSPYNTTEPDTKEDKHRIKKSHEVQEILVPSFQKTPA